MNLATLIALAVLTQSPTAATVVAVSGTVEIAPPHTSDYHAARAGEAVAEGSRVQTGARSEASFKTPAGDVFMLHAHSRMLMSSGAPSNETHHSAVVLFFGKLWSKIAHTEASHFDVHTPTAVAGVRGTQFTTMVGDDGAMTVQVDEGRVEIDNRSQRAMVGAAQRGEAHEGKVLPVQGRGGFDAEKWKSAHFQVMLKSGGSVARTAKKAMDAEFFTLKQLASKGDAAAAKQASLRVNSRIGAFMHWNELAESAGPAMDGAAYIKQTTAEVRAMSAELERLMQEAIDAAGNAADEMMKTPH